MKRTFATEDNRKNKLFEAWNHYLSEIHRGLIAPRFEEIYEGVVTVSELTNKHMGIHVEKSKKIRYLPITSDIQKETCISDQLYLIMGRRDKEWLPLEVISIGSIVNADEGKVHFTVNPLFMNEENKK